MTHSSDAGTIEKEAHRFLVEENLSEAFRLFQRAGRLYRFENNPKQASLCFASAASCWSQKCGEKTFFNAAQSYESAACQAIKAGDYEYAGLLYRQAAINYERDGEFLHFSKSFYHSKECTRIFLTCRIFCPQKINAIVGSRLEEGWLNLVKAFGAWILLSLSSMIWGYGERPERTILAAAGIVVAAAALYATGLLNDGNGCVCPGFFQSLYYSAVTFTTLGYGDIVPCGLNKAVAMIEAFCGIFIIPLFIIGLSRKYLRV